jgi:ABC-type uncharacterized transport system permease subunit
MESFNALLFITNLLTSSIMLATPLLIPALGEIFSERSGVLNLGIEGNMLMGAIVGLATASLSGSVWLGVLAAAVVGMIMNLIMAFWGVTVRTNQVVTGFALTIIGGGLSLFLYRLIFSTRPDFVKVEPLATWKVPFLGDLPMVGEILFQHSPLVYLAYVLVPVAGIILFKTKFGLSIRAVGENPQAADAKGINVYAIRYICIMIGGATAGIGGAFLSLAYLGTFVPNMTAGRGYIAIAVAILARWSPVGAIWSSLLFGVTYSLQYRLQALEVPVPYQLLNALPYIITLLVLVGVSRRAEVPAALTIPYSREHKN